MSILHAEHICAPQVWTTKPTFPAVLHTEKNLCKTILKKVHCIVQTYDPYHSDSIKVYEKILLPKSLYS